MSKDYFQVTIDQGLNLAVDLNQVVEVVKVQGSQICPIPGVNPALLGVVNQRGSLLWVLELARLLNVTDTLFNLKSQAWLNLMILKSNNQALSCQITSLKGIVSLDPEKFNYSDQKLNQYRPFLSATAALNYESILLLDIDSIFNSLLTCTL
jgi:twitching motility protein PilI